MFNQLQLKPALHGNTYLIQLIVYSKILLYIQKDGGREWWTLSHASLCLLDNTIIVIHSLQILVSAVCIDSQVNRSGLLKDLLNWTTLLKTNILCACLHLKIYKHR